MHCEQDFSNNSVGYNSLPDLRVVSSLQGVVSSPHVLKQAQRATSPLYTTLGSGRTQAQEF